VSSSAAGNQRTKLRDGRWLAYQESGDLEGFPVLFFHGAPGSRLRQPRSGLAHARVITVDRPGYGLSEFKSDRTILDWVDDVEQLADALKIGSFSVAGVSGGGAHAAACAYLLPRRVRRAALIASSAPFWVPDVLRGMRTSRRMMYPFVRGRTARSRTLLRLEAERTGLIVRASPELYLRTMYAAAPPCDQAVLRDSDVRRELAGNYAEAFRQGARGYARDLYLLTGPWGFDLTQISIPVDVWHGAMDRTTPLPMAEHLATTIPSAKLNVLSDQGHMLLYSNQPAIFAALIQ
jgi:pimeloyl-ACP methyl ester carboxylesterase